MKTMRITLLAALLLVLASCGEFDTNSSSKDEAWTNDAFVLEQSSLSTQGAADQTRQRKDLRGNRRSVKNFYTDIPKNAKNLKVSTSSGSGDVDLYVRRAQRPTGRDYDCRSAGEANKDTCSFDTPKAERYHIALYGASAYSGVTLKVTFDQGTSAPKPDPKPDPEVSTGHYVQAVYALPKGAPKKDRSALMLKATQRIQKQWAGWGWTFALKPNIITLELPNTCEYYSGNTTWRRTNPAFKAAMEKRGLYNNKTKYIQFIECVRDNSAAAWGGGNQVSLLQGVVANILRNDNGVANRSSVGVVGHELGHTFGFPHENCQGKQPNNYPTPSNGPMCNGKGNWPNVSPASYQRDLLWKNGCNWIAECSAKASQNSLSSQEVTDANDDAVLDNNGNVIWRD